MQYTQIRTVVAGLLAVLVTVRTDSLDAQDGAATGGPTAGPTAVHAYVPASASRPAPASPGSAGLAQGELPAWSGASDIPWTRVICGTGAVVALVCGGVFILKRLNGGLPLTRGRYLEIVECRALGRSGHLFLVKVAGKAVLLAASGNTVTSVVELPDDALAEFDEAAEPAVAGGFASVLRKLAGVAQ